MCGDDGLNATYDGSGYDAAKRANASKIICPALAALYINGDIVVDSEGMTSFEASMAAMSKIGVKNALVATLVHGGSLQIADEQGRYDIFALDKTVAEHPISSGVMEVSKEERPQKFEELASFADANGRIYALQVARIVSYYRQHPFDVNRKATLPLPCYPTIGVPMPGFLKGFAFLGTLAGILGIMGRSDTWIGKMTGTGTYVTVEDLRGLYLEGRYPAGWEERRATLGLFGFLFWTNLVATNCFMRCICCFPPSGPAGNAMMV